MSSYICSPKHFNSIEHSLKMLAYSDQFSFPYSFKVPFPALYDRRNHSTEVIEETICNIMDNLRELNAVCVSLQYRKHLEGSLDKEIETQKQHLMRDKKSKLPLTLTNIELYKSICCLGYQIETEHLKELRELTMEEKNALFFIYQMEQSLAANIIHKLPAYDKAPWGID